MYDVSVTEEVLKLDRSPLKAFALRNMPDISVTEEVSKFERF